MGKRFTKGHASHRNYRCKWCGTVKLTVGHRPGNRGGWKSWCPNPECDGKGVVPWVVPYCPVGATIRFQQARGGESEENPAFENLIRVIEDFMSVAG